MAFIIIVVGTLGISGGTVGTAGPWSGSIVVLRRDSATGAPRQAGRTPELVYWMARDE